MDEQFLKRITELERRVRTLTLAQSGLVHQFAAPASPITLTTSQQVACSITVTLPGRYLALTSADFQTSVASGAGSVCVVGLSFTGTAVFASDPSQGLVDAVLIARFTGSSHHSFSYIAPGGIVNMVVSKNNAAGTNTMLSSGNSYLHLIRTGDA